MINFNNDLSEKQKERLEILIGDYPINAFPDLYRNAILKISLYLNVYVSIVANSMLTELAYLLSNFMDAATGRGDKGQPCSLFSLSIAESGDGKDSTFRLVCKISEEHQNDIFENYQKEYIIWKNTPKLERGNEPVFEITRYDSATTQGLTLQITKSQSRSHILSTAEAGTFFTGYSMSTETTGASISSLNNLVDEGKINNLLKGQERIEYCNNIRFSILLAVQDVIARPALLNKMLREQGFLARVLFAAPPSPPFYEKTIDDMIDIYSDFDLIKYWNMCSKYISNQKFNNEITIIKYSDLALDEFIKFDNFIRKECLDGGLYYDISAYAKRSRQYVWRIASILTYVSGSIVIDDKIINSAINIIKFSLSEWIKYYAIDEESNSQILEKWLLAKFSKGKKDILISSINQMAPKVLRNARVRDEALQHLFDLNKINIFKGDDGKDYVQLLNC